MSRPVPDPDPAGAPFWEACARHELTVQTCSACGATRYPPRPMCPRCRSMEHAFQPASGRGTVWSWVVAHRPVLPAFADEVPYLVAVVELEEGVRIVGRLFADEAHVDMPVVVDWEDVADGVALPCWRPA